MSATEQWVSPQSDQSAGTYSKNTKNTGNMSMSSAKRSELENMSQGAIVTEHRDLIQKSANYRQKKIKLKRDNDYLKKQLEKFELQIEKLEEHRDQDAEALLAQEEKLSQLKGRYRVSENPNEITKTNKAITKLAKEENPVLKEVKGRLENTTEYFRELADAAPAWYEQLRKLKFYGDKQTNEILLRQIHIYVEQIQEKAKDYSKHKITNYDDNQNLRSKHREKHKEHELLKDDTLEDYKQWFGYQRKLNFYETDFMIEREEIDKTK
jgi:hypothetical protein